MYGLVLKGLARFRFRVEGLGFRVATQDLAGVWRLISRKHETPNFRDSLFRVTSSRPPVQEMPAASTGIVIGLGGQIIRAPCTF